MKTIEMIAAGLSSDQRTVILFVVLLLAVLVIVTQRLLFKHMIDKIRAAFNKIERFEAVKFDVEKKGHLGGLMSEIEDMSAAVAVLSEDKKRARRHEQQNILLAKIDDEMSVPNKSYFFELVKKRENNCGHALLISIKFTNLIKLFTIKGTELTNKVLSESLNRIQEHSSPESFIGRISTSNFMLFVPAENDLTERRIIELIMDIQTELEGSHVLGQSDYYLQPCFGVAYRNLDSANSLVDLVHLAELAIIEKSNMVAKGIYMSHSTLQCEGNDKYKMEVALRNSITNREFSVVYQPIVSLTDTTVSLETLVRWKYKEEWVSPVVFIPIIEDLGLISQLTRLVLDKIIKDYDFLSKMHPNLNYISMNISPKMLNEADYSFLFYVNEQIATKKISQNQICFEITENEVLNTNTLLFIEESKRQGYLIAIDDFGTGYSSMAYIANYTFNILKVDRAFVRQLEQNHKQREVAFSIIKLAKRLNIQVVAEGVETEGQLDILREMGTDAIQGFYYSKPQFIDEWVPLEIDADKKVVTA